MPMPNALEYLEALLALAGTPAVLTRQPPGFVPTTTLRRKIQAYLCKMCSDPPSGLVLSCDPAMMSNGHLMSSYCGRFARCIVRHNDLYPSGDCARRSVLIKACCVAVAFGPVAADGTTAATPSMPSLQWAS